MKRVVVRIPPNLREGLAVISDFFKKAVPQSSNPNFVISFEVAEVGDRKTMELSASEGLTADQVRVIEQAIDLWTVEAVTEGGNPWQIAKRLMEE